MRKTTALTAASAAIKTQLNNSVNKTYCSQYKIKQKHMVFIMRQQFRLLWHKNYTNTHNNNNAAMYVHTKKKQQKQKQTNNNRCCQYFITKIFTTIGKKNKKTMPQN